MAELTRCPRCGAVLPGGNQGHGDCPACLLEEGLKLAKEESLEQPAGSRELGAQDLANLERIQGCFPHLEILEPLGAGGMGVVYKARQKRLDRWVALKVMAPRVANDPAFAERFSREARALAKLSHPNIVLVHDFGDVDGLFYLMMEFVAGTNLREAIQKQVLTPSEALLVVPQICEGLQYAHEQGVVHRDIKPENILLDETGKVKIADFGLAKLVGGTRADFTLTGASQIMGTPHYMAPEQMNRPLDVDHRADIYSLGVVFYEMLTNELPVGQFPPPSNRAKVDGRLDRVVMKALAQEPDNRYQHVSEVRTEVEDVSGGKSRPNQRQSNGFSLGVEPWMERIPGGALVVGGASLLMSWFWLVVFQIPSINTDEEWLTGAYPFAFLTFLLLKPYCQGKTMAGAVALRFLAFASQIAALVLISRPSAMASGARTVVFEGMAAILVVTCHLFYDEWARRNRWPAFFAGALFLLIATIMHAALGWNPSSEAFYFSSGMVAIISASSCLVYFVLPGKDRNNYYPIVRAGLVGAVGAMIYFNRYIF